MSWAISFATLISPARRASSVDALPIPRAMDKRNSSMATPMRMTPITTAPMMSRIAPGFRPPAFGAGSDMLILSTGYIRWLMTMGSRLGRQLHWAGSEQCGRRAVLPSPSLLAHEVFPLRVFQARDGRLVLHELHPSDCILVRAGCAHQCHTSPRGGGK